MSEKPMSQVDERTLLDQVFRPELEPGERLLWAGRPGQGIVFRSIDILLVPFSFLWCGFAYFGAFSVHRATHKLSTGGKAAEIPNGFEFMPRLFMAFFCLIGLYFALGRFLHDKYRRAKVYYAITNNRVIIVSKLFKNSVSSHYYEGMDDITMDVSKNGRGSIHLNGRKSFSMMFQMNPWLPNGQGVLEGISDVRNVFEIIQKERRTSRKNAS